MDTTKVVHHDNQHRSCMSRSTAHTKTRDAFYDSVWLSTHHSGPCINRRRKTRDITTSCEVKVKRCAESIKNQRIATPSPCLTSRRVRLINVSTASNLPPPPTPYQCTPPADIYVIYRNGNSPKWTVRHNSFHLALAKSYIPQALTTFQSQTICGTNTPATPRESRVGGWAAKRYGRSEGAATFIVLIMLHSEARREHGSAL